MTRAIRLWLALAVVALAATAGCSTGTPSARTMLRSKAATKSAARARAWALTRSGSRAVGPYGFPAPRPGLHLDPALLRLGRSVHLDVGAELTQTERRVLRVLHGHPVDIHVRVDDTYLVPETGVGGVTRADTSIVIDVQPHAPVGTLSTLHDWLPFVLAHELDHAVRFEYGPGIVGRMLDYIVTEGLADSFASAMFPNLPPSPTDTTLNRQQLRHYWHNAQQILYEIPPRQLHDEWLFGNRQFPDNTGYAMGTALIHSVRLHHPHMSWAALTRLDSQTLLDISHFRP